MQRVGRLDEALAEALKSLTLGDKIHWERNTAFCKKCLGRLYRMLGMRATDAETRSGMFRRSIESLREAVGIFRRMDKFGPDCPEVGDCYSLAARTFLVAGQIKDARAYLKKAAERLTDETDKDYLDYRILEGDYAEATNDADLAEQHYQFVIDSTSTSDSEKSEIAPAPFISGEYAGQDVRGKWQLPDFERAAHIWDELKERKPAAEARWQMILLEDKLSTGAIARLNRASAAGEDHRGADAHTAVGGAFQQQSPSRRRRTDLLGSFGQ